MKSLTIAVAVIGALSFATAASACPFGSMKTETTAEAPILKPKVGS